MGFRTGSASPCQFHHADRELYISVHGDDFTVVGPTESLRWFEKEINKFYETTVQKLGPTTEGMQSEIRVLNRVIVWWADGLAYEPDQRHAELIIRELGAGQC